MIDRTFFRFIAVGIGNTILGLLVIYGFMLVTSNFVANFLGYVFVVPVSFMTHRSWSFRDGGDLERTFIRYLPTALLGYGMNVFILKMGLSIGANIYVAQAVAISAYVITTYILSRVFVFLNPHPD